MQERISLSTKLILFCIFVGFMFASLFYIMDSVGKQKLAQKVEQKVSRVLVTSYHAPKNIPNGYIKVYEDKETDRVFYLNKDVSGFDGLVSKVKLEGQPGLSRVVKQEENVLYVEPGDLSKIYAGLSGTLVFDENGSAVGFVSELTSDSLIKVVCRF